MKSKLANLKKVQYETMMWDNEHVEDIVEGKEQVIKIAKPE